MGRSGGPGGGGGFSGGGRSGGFSGGGRRSGGFSGGGGFRGGSGGRSGGPRPGGFGGRPVGGPPMGGPAPRPHVHVPFFGGYGGFGGFGGFGRPMGAPAGGGCGCGGCLGGLVAVVIVALVCALLTTSLSTCSGTPVYGGTSYQQGQSESSQTVREKLPASAVNKTDWYTDADGDWIGSASRLTEGLEHFYDKTGVQPYVYILPNGESTSTEELTDLAEQLYGELFTDEGHFLLVFCDDGSGSFNCGYTVGTEASAIMDQEALGILADELDYAYNNAGTEEEVFSDAFSETADRIMSAAEDEQRDQTLGTVALVAAGVGVVAVAAVIIVRRRKAKQDEEDKRMEDILNTPLEKFGDKDVEDLADKYEKDSPVTGDKD